MSTRNVLLGAAAIAASLHLGAQPAAPSPATDGTGASDYRPYRAAEVRDWRQSNDSVHRADVPSGHDHAMHGHVAHRAPPAEPAAMPAPPSPRATPAPAPPAPPPDSHDHHQGHHP